MDTTSVLCILDALDTKCMKNTSEESSAETEANIYIYIFHFTCDGVPFCDLLTQQVIYNAIRTELVGYSVQFDQDLSVGSSNDCWIDSTAVMAF
jgi:hypothetical protein